MEEFEECDVLWSDNHYYSSHCSNNVATHHHDNLDWKEEVFMSSSPSLEHNSQLDCKMITNKKKMKSTTMKKMSTTSHFSLPINVPTYLAGNSCRTTSNAQMDAYESHCQHDLEEDEEDDNIPPHLMVARRFAQNNAVFSVCTGTGRTLKGRDLSQVRNSILRLTGFLES